MSVFTIRQPHEELGAVHKFQTHAQLTGVRMKSFSASCADKEPEVTDGLQLDLKHSVCRAALDGASAHFDVKLEIGALADKDPSKQVFQVECLFDLTYTLAPEYHPQPAEMEAFQKANAVFHCWPYMREFVQSATQRMGMMIPPIPLLRLEPLPPAKEPEAVETREPLPRRRSARSTKERPAIKK